MTADTWADAICLHYQLSEGIPFDGIALSRAIASNIGLCLAMDAPKDNIKSDHCGVFHDHFKPTTAKSKKNVWCYYATIRGGKPPNDKR